MRVPKEKPDAKPDKGHEQNGRRYPLGALTLRACDVRHYFASDRPVVRIFVSEMIR